MDLVFQGLVAAHVKLIAPSRSPSINAAMDFTKTTIFVSFPVNGFQLFSSLIRKFSNHDDENE